MPGRGGGRKKESEDCMPGGDAGRKREREDCMLIGGESEGSEDRWEYTQFAKF